jgi:AcrR family transcriptional regulator
LNEPPKAGDIISACLVEFSKYGYEKANTNRISELAGVSKGLIFHYFGSKQSLYLKAVEKCVLDLTSLFENIAVTDPSFNDLLAYYIRLKINFFRDNPMHFKIISDAFFSPPPGLKEDISALYAHVLPFSEKYTDLLISRLRLKKSITAAHARALFAAVGNICEQKYASEIALCEDNFEKLGDRIKSEYVELINLVLNGIAEGE